MHMASGQGDQGVVDADVLDPTLEDILDDSSRPKEGFLFCAACSHVIGHVQDRIEVNGAFEHTCTNPYGYVHRFGCHREAHGLRDQRRAASRRQLVHGFRWRLAACGNCDTHMGWLFERAGEHFFGLILDRIQVD